MYAVIINSFLLLCFSKQYSDVEEAAACRRALHGIKWPVTSPKILDVDFADQDEVGYAVMQGLKPASKLSCFGPGSLSVKPRERHASRAVRSATRVVR